MTDRGGLLLAAALCLVVSGLGALAAPNEQCSQPPSWQLDGIDFMEAERLERLRLELQADGVTDVSFGVINGKGFISKLHLRELEGKVNFGVYQDTARANVWRLLGGKKDDFIIYDRCGRLAKHIRMPEAYLRRPDVEDAIREVYAGGPCGHCAAYPGPETTPRPVLTTPGLLTSGSVLTMASDIGSGDLDEEFISNTSMSDGDVSNAPLPTSISPQNGASVDNVTKSVMFPEHDNTESQQRNNTRHHRRHYRNHRDRSHHQRSQEEDTAN